MNHLLMREMSTESSSRYLILSLAKKSQGYRFLSFRQRRGVQKLKTLVTTSGYTWLLMGLN